MLKRTEPLNPRLISLPFTKPVLKNAPRRVKPKPRAPLVTVTDDGDIPLAVPQKKP
jgi:hypothetical protein